MRDKTERTWMRTHSGRLMNLLDPSDDWSITLDDISYALARIFRFTGHTEVTVAEHSVSVMLALYYQPRFPDVILGGTEITVREALLIALLHDAHEAYVGDISLPMKAAIGRVARKGLLVDLTADNPVTLIKRGIQRQIHKEFGLPEVVPKALREAIAVADAKMLDIEPMLDRQWHIPPWNIANAANRFYSAVMSLWKFDTSVDFIGQFAGDNGSYIKEVQ